MTVHFKLWVASLGKKNKQEQCTNSSFLVYNFCSQFSFYLFITTSDARMLKKRQMGRGDVGIGGGASGGIGLNAGAGAASGAGGRRGGNGSVGGGAGSGSNDRFGSATGFNGAGFQH